MSLHFTYSLNCSYSLIHNLNRCSMQLLVFVCEMSQGLAKISPNYSLCKSCWSLQKHLPSQHNLLVMDSLWLPSDTCIYFGLHEFCMLLHKFKGSVGFIWDIHDHFCCNHTLHKVLFIKTVKVRSAWEMKENYTQEEIDMYLSCAQCKYTIWTSVCVLCCMLHTCRGSSSALCSITAPFPLSPTALGRVPEGEIIYCRVCQRQWGGLSMGPASLPCLGLPLLPARPFSSAWHSGDSRTEPEANLSLPHSPSRMIFLSVFSTLGPRVLMRPNGCQ